MDKKKPVFSIFFFTVLLIGAVYLRLDRMYIGLVNAKGESYERNINDVYTLGIELTQSQNSVNTYIPKFYENDWQTAKMYAGFLKMDREASETEDYYAFYNGMATLYVYKYINYLRYELNPEYYFYGDISIASDTDALDLAVKFIDGSMLYLNYEEAEVTYEDGIYTVTLINRLGSLFNYAFPTSVMLDDCGNILSLDYYFITYEKLGNVKIKSMREAFQELPVSFDDLSINIDKCKLVYVYKDSIVQPAYRFGGTASDSSIFECVVEASTY